MESQDFWYETYHPRGKKPMTWPGGYTVAVLVTLNLEVWEREPSPSVFPGGPRLSEYHGSDLLNYVWREYGHRVGFWRISKLLQKLDVTASVALNGEAVERIPQIVQECKDNGWEFVGHAYTQHDLLGRFKENPNGERELIRRTLETIQRGTGKRPKGWLSPAIVFTRNTPRILAEEGLKFMCDLCNDDEPYIIHVGDKKLVSIPYELENNDYHLFFRWGRSASEYFQTLKEAFHVLSEEGKYRPMIMNIGIHPHVIGRPYRIVGLQRALEYLKAQGSAWFPSREEIADFVLREYQS